MELSDYINLTLTEIAKGVKKANGALKTTGGHTLKESPIIDGFPFAKVSSKSSNPIIKVGFRVGVEVEETATTDSKFGGSLKVISVDSESTSKDGKRNIHEVSFELPLILP